MERELGERDDPAMHIAGIDTDALNGPAEDIIWRGMRRANILARTAQPQEHTSSRHARARQLAAPVMDCTAHARYVLLPSAGVVIPRNRYPKMSAPVMTRCVLPQTRMISRSIMSRCGLHGEDCS